MHEAPGTVLPSYGNTAYALRHILRHACVVGGVVGGGSSALQKVCLRAPVCPRFQEPIQVNEPQSSPGGSVMASRLFSLSEMFKYCNQPPVLPTARATVVLSEKKKETHEV